MNFQQANKYLLNKFQQHQFAEHVRSNKRHVSQIVVEKCSNGTELIVSFPGYKASETSGILVFDYRVDIRKDPFTTSLSHANIITDIYNKIVYGGMDAAELRKVLIRFFFRGEIDLPAIIPKLAYISTCPGQKLIMEAKAAHANKFYNQTGNSFDLTPEELFCSIKWIVLQEDINYPVSKGFEGRRMPLARYLETIFVTQNRMYSLADVIQRALAHSRPVLWPELKYPYIT